MSAPQKKTLQSKNGNEFSFKMSVEKLSSGFYIQMTSSCFKNGVNAKNITKSSFLIEKDNVEIDGLMQEEDVDLLAMRRFSFRVLDIPT